MKETERGRWECAKEETKIMKENRQREKEMGRKREPPREEEIKTNNQFE